MSIDWKSKNCQANKNQDSWAIRDHEKGLVDQLEDRRLCKAEALGSNPSGSMKPRIKIRGLKIDLKTPDSNPVFERTTNALIGVMPLRKGR